MDGIANNFMIFRFAVSSVLALGGIACIVLGYVLFSKGAGLKRGLDNLEIGHDKFKVSSAGMSVGGVLMLTSAVWAYFSYASVAKLEMAGSLAEPAISISEDFGATPSVRVVKALPAEKSKGWEVGSAVPMDVKAVPVEGVGDYTYIQEGGELYILNKRREVVQSIGFGRGANAEPEVTVTLPEAAAEWRPLAPPVE